MLYLVFLVTLLVPSIAFCEAGKAMDNVIYTLLVGIIILAVFTSSLYYLIWKKCKTKFRIFYLIGIPLLLIFPLISIFKPPIIVIFHLLLYLLIVLLLIDLLILSLKIKNFFFKVISILAVLVLAWYMIVVLYIYSQYFHL
jgi:hypothetical protein